MNNQKPNNTERVDRQYYLESLRTELNNKFNELNTQEIQKRIS